MKNNMKRVICYIAKYLGLFRLCRYLFRRRLTILCYHGFEIDDEASFMPGVFMRQSTFDKRMSRLVEDGYKVLPLGEAVERLGQGTLPPNAVSITIDDGFFSVLDKAAPILERYRLPSMLYVASYHVEKGTPVFRLTVQYMLWKTTRRIVHIDHERWGLRGTYDLANPTVAHALCWQLIAFGETECNEVQRQAICYEFGELLGVSYQGIMNSRQFGLLTPAELVRIHDGGMDIELHTRRHRICGDDKRQVVDEIVENARDLHAILPKRYAHFCYPSGGWQPKHLAWLQEAGVATATTCDPGMNTAGTHRLALYRFLDSDDCPDILFEAELCGFNELLRVVSGRRRAGDRLRRQGESASPVPPAGVVAPAMVRQVRTDRNALRV